MEAPINVSDKALVRLEAVKAAARVCSPREGVGNLLIHAGWLADYILSGESPAITPSGPSSPS